MPKRLARNPSIRSLNPAMRKIAKATRIWFDAIAQTIKGTSRIRATVIRLGILKPAPRLIGRTVLDGRPHSFRSQYTCDHVVAQAAIPKYRAMRIGRLSTRTPGGRQWRTREKV